MSRPASAPTPDVTAGAAWGPVPVEAGSDAMPPAMKAAEVMTIM
ncbi:MULTISPECIES: hypothetical protein [Streptomyces]|nr:hypothetical protein [Streptomyces katrae]